MLLTQLEEDLLEDLGKDAHGLWELFEFISLHAPVSSDGEVLDMGRDLLSIWGQRGWIEALSPNGEPLRIDMGALIDKLGSGVLVPSPHVPRLSLTDKAFADAQTW